MKRIVLSCAVSLLGTAGLDVGLGQLISVLFTPRPTLGSESFDLAPLGSQLVTIAAQIIFFVVCMPLGAVVIYRYVLGVQRTDSGSTSRRTKSDRSS